MPTLKNVVTPKETANAAAVMRFICFVLRNDFMLFIPSFLNKPPNLRCFILIYSGTQDLYLCPRDYYLLNMSEEGMVS